MVRKELSIKVAGNAKDIANEVIRIWAFFEKIKVNNAANMKNIILRNICNRKVFLSTRLNLDLFIKK